MSARWDCLSCQTMQEAGSPWCLVCGANPPANGAREFVGDDGHDWHVVRFPSTACGANYADVERVDGTKRSVRQAELLRRAGIELPDVSE